MTWQSILPTWESFAAACRVDEPDETESTVLFFRGAGFGLPLVSALFADDLFDNSTAEPAPQPVERLS